MNTPAPKSKIIVIAGPTASGKSSLALRFAEQLGGEILSVDSGGVYAGAAIGTAQPDAAALGRVRHHLVGHVQPNEQYHAGRFLEEAMGVIGAAAEAKRPVVAVGGTTLYLTALLNGLVPVAPGDPVYRAQLEARKLPELYAELQRSDPEKAAKLHPNDRLRISRALELQHTEHAPASKLHEEHQHTSGSVDALMMVLCWKRAELYRRINERVVEMFRQGLVREVWGLVDKFGDKAPVLSSLGFAEVLAAGRKPSATAEAGLVDAIQQSTRRYAKRQMTYWRNEPQKRMWSMEPHSQAVFVMPEGSNEYECVSSNVTFEEALQRGRAWLADSAVSGSSVLYVSGEQLVGNG